MKCLSAAQRMVERAGPRAHANRRRIIVLDPGLRERGGHHFEFAQMLCSEFRRSSAVTLYANVCALPSVVATLRARPLFRFDLYPSDRRQSFDQAYDEITTSMLDALRRIAPAEYDARTIVVVHTMTVFGLGALAQWYAALDTSKRPRLFVQFHHRLDFGVEPIARKSRAYELAKAATAVLFAAGDVRFTSSSAVLSERIEQELERPCEPMPVPVRWPLVLRRTPPPADATFGFFGGLRREKGAHVLAQAIAAFVAVHPDVRFIVHAPPGPSDVDAVRLLAAISQVELVERSFAEKADYFACLDRVRCILLPYDPDAYAERTSGILLEAIGLGFPVVVTAGTWLAREFIARSAQGWIMPEYSATALAAGLEHVHATLGRRADRPMPNAAVIDHHSPEKFCATLLQMFEPAGEPLGVNVGTTADGNSQ